MERYKVATCEGYAITPAGRTSGRTPFGLTATVLDTHYAHREVRSYRSEAPHGGHTPGLGRDGALRAAEAYAKWLNST